MKAIEAVYCKSCGKEKQFVECPSCEGQGTIDIDDDGYGYNMAECPGCDGQGGNLICPQCHPECFNGR